MEKICQCIKTEQPASCMLTGFPLWVGGEGGRRTTFPRSPAVSSSRRGLTSLFGMGRGAPPRHSRHLSLIGLSGWGENGHKGYRTQERKLSGH